MNVSSIYDYLAERLVGRCVAEIGMAEGVLAIEFSGETASQFHLVEKVEVRAGSCNWRISFPTGERLEGGFLLNVNPRVLCDVLAARFSRENRVSKIVNPSPRELRLEFECGMFIDFRGECDDETVCELLFADGGRCSFRAGRGFLLQTADQLNDFDSGLRYPVRIEKRIPRVKRTSTFDLKAVNSYLESYLFWVYGIPQDRLEAWEELLGGFVHVPSRSLTHPDLFVLCIGLTDEEVSRRLTMKLKKAPIPYDYGISAVMVTITDLNGVTVPDYVMQVHKRLGGDFRVECALVSQ